MPGKKGFLENITVRMTGRVSPSFVSMAEREGFEPPIALRLCLISSQVHSTGLCHLSAFLQHFTRLSGNLLLAAGSFYRTCAPGNSLDRRLRVIHTATCLPLGHLFRPAPQSSPTVYKVHSCHHQSTGERVAIAMPRVALACAGRTASIRAPSSLSLLP
jgi:hypothetical protein